MHAAITPIQLETKSVDTLGSVSAKTTPTHKITIAQYACDEEYVLHPHRFSRLNGYGYNVPQSWVVAQSFAPGFEPGKQIKVLQVTEPGVPDNPSPTPHVGAQPCGSPCTQYPDNWCVAEY